MGLYYSHNTRWNALPSWAEFLFGLGRIAAASSRGDNQLVLGLALPSRAFAAPFTALGVVVQMCSMSRSKALSNEERFKLISSLPVGTKLLQLKEGRLHIAEYKGLVLDTPEPRLRVALQGRIGGRRKEDAMTVLLRPHETVGLSVAPDQSVDLPRVLRGRPVFGQDFLSCIFEGYNPDRFIMESSLWCAILGRAATLQAECSVEIAGVPQPGRYVSGKLSDALRVRRFFTHGDHYRSDVVPVGGLNQAVPNGEIPIVTVFDGATAFLRWRDHWRGSAVWVVLLDRTERLFEEAADMLNAEYAGRLGDAPVLSEYVPTGVDVMGYLSLKEVK